MSVIIIGKQISRQFSTILQAALLVPISDPIDPVVDRRGLLAS